MKSWGGSKFRGIRGDDDVIAVALGTPNPAMGLQSQNRTMRGMPFQPGNLNLPADSLARAIPPGMLGAIQQVAGGGQPFDGGELMAIMQSQLGQRGFGLYGYPPPPAPANGLPGPAAPPPAAAPPAGLGFSGGLPVGIPGLLQRLMAKVRMAQQAGASGAPAPAPLPVTAPVDLSGVPRSFLEGAAQSGGRGLGGLGLRDRGIFRRRPIDPEDRE